MSLFSTLLGGWQLTAIAAGGAALVAGGTAWEIQEWRLGEQIAAAEADLATYRASVTAAAAEAAIAAKATEDKAAASVAALDQLHQKELDDDAQKTRALGAALDAGTLRLSVAATCPTNTGGTLPGAAAAASLGHDATVRAELSAATARSLLALSAAADRCTVQLRTLQDYVTAVGAPSHTAAK